MHLFLHDSVKLLVFRGIQIQAFHVRNLRHGGTWCAERFEQRVTERLVFLVVARFHHYQANSKQEHWTPRTFKFLLEIWIFVVAYPVSSHNDTRHLLKSTTVNPQKKDDFLVKTWSHGRSSWGAYHSTLVNYSGKCINHHYSTDQEVYSPPNPPVISNRTHWMDPFNP